MKKLSLFLFMASTVSAFLPILAQAQSAPIPITTCQDLQNIGNTNYRNANGQLQPEPFNGNYQLTNDIDCSATASWNNGLGFIPIGNPAQSGDTSTNFTGSFSGMSSDGKTIFAIKNLTILQPQNNLVGIFEDLLGANIHDLKVLNISVTGKNYASALAFSADSSTTISHVYIDGTFSSSNQASGVVAFLGTSSLYQVGVHATLQAPNVQGLVQENDSSTINQCYANITVTTGASNVAGLVGQNNLQAQVNNSYARGNVTAATNIYGLIGDNAGSSITDSYSAMVMSASNKSGLVGTEEYGGTTTASYWDATVSGAVTSADGIALTTQAMTGLLAGLSTNIWNYPIFDYPHLAWELIYRVQSTINSALGAVQSSAYDTNTAAFGVIDNNPPFVAVFGYNGQNWTQQAKLTSPGTSSQFFGLNVLLSSGHLAVADNSGDIYLYDQSGTSWNYVQKITPPLTVDAFQWGYPGRIVLKGNTLLVEGAATIYQYTYANNTWTQNGYAVNGTTYATDFGSGQVVMAMDNSGQLAVAGQVGQNNALIYVFQQSGSAFTVESTSTRGINLDLNNFNAESFGLAINGNMIAFYQTQPDDFSAAYIRPNPTAAWGAQNILASSYHGQNYQYNDVVVQNGRVILSVLQVTVGEVLSFRYGAGQWYSSQTLNSGILFSADDSNLVLNDQTNGTIDIDSLLSPFVQVTISLSSGFQGTITSQPSGINCNGTTGCVGNFLVDQPLALTYAGNSYVSSWGGANCVSGSPTCIVTPDTNIYLNIANPTAYPVTLIAATSGGTIYPSGTIYVNSGASQTINVGPNAGYQASLTLDGTPVALINNQYILNDVTMAHTLSASFSFIPLTNLTITYPTNTNGQILVNFSSAQVLTRGNILLQVADPSAPSVWYTLSGNYAFISNGNNTYTISLPAAGYPANVLVKVNNQIPQVIVPVIITNLTVTYPTSPNGEIMAGFSANQPLTRGGVEVQVASPNAPTVWYTLTGNYAFVSDGNDTYTVLLPASGFPSGTLIRIS